MVIIKNIY